MSRRESAGPRSRLEPFFVHVGSFVAVIVYFVILGQASDPTAGIRTALPVALAVMSAYMLAAQRRHLLKCFDIGLWSMFAVGTAAVLGGWELARSLFAEYSVAILFTTLGLVAVIPLLLGIEPFTVFFARRTTPSWQQKTRDFLIINRVITAWFGLLFTAAALLAAWRPHDILFTLVYPNLLVFVAGLPSQRWIPPLYFRLFGVRAPETVEAAILGMPLVFDAKTAGDAEAGIQFRIGGDEGGDFWLRVAKGRCEGAEGEIASPDLTIHAPSSVWLDIVRGEIDGTRALIEGEYTVEGRAEILMRFSEWFPSRS
jgi:putative sterol carrier protein